MFVLSIQRRRNYRFQRIPIEVEEIWPARKRPVIGVDDVDSERALDVVVDLPNRSGGSFFRDLYRLRREDRVLSAALPSSMLAGTIFERLQLNRSNQQQQRIVVVKQFHRIGQLVLRSGREMHLADAAAEIWN